MPKSFAADRVSPLATILDFEGLVASLAAYQASTRTALVALRLGGAERPPAALAGALADIVAGRPGWTVAVARLAGHFHAGASLASSPVAEPEYRANPGSRA